MGKFAAAFGWSFTVTNLLSALLVVLKERFVEVREWLTAPTGNDWITHGLLVVLVFVVLGFLLLQDEVDEFDEAAPRMLAGSAAASVVVGIAIIAGFYGYAG